MAVELSCLACGRAGLRGTDAAWRCPGCAREYPIVGGVARFVSRELYAESFGYQWNRFSRAQLDSATGTTRSRDTFVEKTGWALGDLRGARVFDAGCGMGRFAEVCADAGAEVHAVDLSTAVDAAARNLGHRANIHLYQADIMRLPFAPDTFDFVYSIGVLHHTPDTRAAFLRLPSLLRPGGRIAIWVYASRLRWLGTSPLLRTVTPRLPKPWLLRLSRVAVPLYHVHRMPLLGRLTRGALPISLDPDPEWRWLDTFDWYSPRYQWKHGAAEVEAWFREAGLTMIQRGSFPTSVSGVRAPRGS